MSKPPAPPGGAKRIGIAELESTLRQRFRVTDTVVELGNTTICVMHPANSDELINEEDFVRDERMPYWADIWPSSRVLGRYLLERASPPGRLLELGCGAGLVAACAAASGHVVTATDYDENALTFARLNVVRNSGVEPLVRMVDWRSFPTDLGTFDLVVASDVLYERSYVEPLAHAMDMTLGVGGRAIIADPGRVGREAFVAAAEQRGLLVDAALVIPLAVGDITQQIALLMITRG